MKNQLLIIAFLLTATGALAQLTVKPNGPIDSYIYVKDQILYVKEGIALTINPNPTVEASIYLRDNGQLIQGGTSSTNDGDGFLSVQQNTNPTNAYAYYYWCSPVGNPASADVPLAGNNKYFGLNSIYETLGDPLGTNARMSTPIPGRDGFSDPLTISRRWMYIHEEPGTEAESNYHRINATNGAPAGFGFTMKGVNQGADAGNPGTGTNHDQIYEFRGRPNNGDFIIPVEGPAYSGTGGGVPNAMMTLSGNPYPSALDLNRVFWEGTNNPISAFYFYDEDRSAMSHNYSDKPFGYGVFIPGTEDFNGKPGDPAFIAGTYVNAPFFIWNAAGGATGSTAPVNNIPTEHRFAPIGQGIMFVGSGSPQDILIKNSHRRYIKEDSDHSVFHRPTNDLSTDSERSSLSTYSNLPSQVDNRLPQTRFYAVFDEGITREILLTFSDQSTDGYDRGMDGLSPMGLKTDAYFPVGEDSNRLPYVINSVNYDESKQIPIAFKLNKTTQIRLSIVEEVKKPYEIMYLYDRQENIFRRLGYQNTYPFSLTLPAGNYDNRFFMVFKKAEGRQSSPFTTDEEESKIVASIKLFQNNPAQELQISNPEGHSLKSAAMYDMNGKMVIQKQNLGSNNTYTFYTGNLSEGVYLVKLTTAEDVIIDYKAIVSN